MSSKKAIYIQNLSKSYQIYDKPKDRLKQFILPRIRRAIGLLPVQYFREFWALRDVNFSVNKGETVGIIGSNGSGKSTLLQLICGTLNPTLGNIEVHGRIAALLELGSGFNPEFTGSENVCMSAAVLGLSRQEIEQRFDSIVEFADIGQFINLPVKTYSSGMLVRLAFAVISHVDASILVIDEALAVGDAEFSRKCIRFLERFMETGTVLFVSHDMASIKSLCDRVVWIDKGFIKMIGDPKTISDAYLKYVYDPLPRGNASKFNSAQLLTEEIAKPRVTRDIRQDFLNASNLRNDIEVLQMQPHLNGFGSGGVTLTHVSIIDAGDTPLSWIVGGEKVELRIEGVANQSLDQLIVGFAFRDRLGQYLFADNTFLSYCDSPLFISSQEHFRACFRFVMPILRAGDYSIDVAVANGNQNDHVQQLWIHDALTFKCVTSSVCTGLVGVPMEHIYLEVK